MFAIRINPGFVYLAFVYADSTVQRAFLPADSLQNPPITQGFKPRRCSGFWLLTGIWRSSRSENDKTLPISYQPLTDNLNRL